MGWRYTSQCWSRCMHPSTDVGWGTCTGEPRYVGVAAYRMVPQYMSHQPTSVLVVAACVAVAATTREEQ